MQQCHPVDILGYDTVPDSPQVPVRLYVWKAAGGVESKPGLQGYMVHYEWRSGGLNLPPCVLNTDGL